MNEEDLEIIEDQILEQETMIDEEVYND